MSNKKLRVFLVCLWALLTGLTTVVAQPTNPVVVVDLLVVYTPAARIAAGGAEAIQSQVRQAILETDRVFQNSRVAARVRLVRCSEIFYEESGNLFGDLEALRSTNDGFMDEVHSLRNEVAADLVCLVAEEPYDVSFYSLQGPSSANAFSAIRLSALTGGYFLPAALSFNFGCQQEREFANSSGAFPYAYGFSFWGEDGIWYSTVESSSGVRVPYFSNPALEYKGAFLGIPRGEPNAADNTRVLNQTAPLVAAFHGGANRTIPPHVRLLLPPLETNVAAGQPITFLAEASDLDGTVSTVEFFADGQRLGGASKPPYVLSISNLPPGQHVLVSAATDNSGVESVSEFTTIFVGPANDDFARRTAISGND
ncbi:MAG: peptidyl-Asp metallopeptidase, partial [Verrucomicrobiales bacterium]|nr:peptidyl-Asp metallopeptidase [Verrucomicrobiales bacterium]